MMREITLPLLGYVAIAAVVAVVFFFAGVKLAMVLLKADLNISVSVWRKDRGPAAGGDDDGDDPHDDGEFPDDDPDPQDPAVEPESASDGPRVQIPQQARHRLGVLNRDSWPLQPVASRGRHRPGAGRIPCQSLVEVCHGVAA